MVNFQGVSVRLIDSITGQPLNECPCSADQAVGDNNVTSSYLSYSRGQTFWVEYEAHEPLPPNAKFLFTFYHDDQRIASWDCVGKNGYKGKATFGIHFEGQNEKGNEPIFQRQLFGFPDKPHGCQRALSSCFRIKVFRVQARQRLPVTAIPNVDRTYSDIERSHAPNLVLKHGGYLPKHAPKRYYGYQLLDPTDKAFITFQFFYRDFDYAGESGPVPWDSVRSQTAQQSNTLPVPSSIAATDHINGRPQIEEKDQKEALHLNPAPEPEAVTPPPFITPTLPALLVDDEVIAVKTTGNLRQAQLRHKIKSMAKDRVPFSGKLQGLTERAKARRAK